MAIEATAGLKARGLKTTLIARGGGEGYGSEVLHNARSLGLNVRDISAQCDNPGDFLNVLTANCEGADLLNLRFHCPQA
jgi:hypothetical protein